MSQYGNYNEPTFYSHCKVNDTIEKAIKKAEFKLEKRIRLFEQELNIHCIALRLSKEFNPKYYLDVFNLRVAIEHLFVIKSQTMPKFKVGGLIEYGKVTTEEDVFVKGCFDNRSNKLFKDIVFK